MKKPLLLSVAMLVSCNTLQYSNPEEGPRARVRFITNTSSPALVLKYSDGECHGEEEMMRLRNGVFLNPSPARLGMPLWDFHDNAAKEVYISAPSRFNGVFKVLNSQGGQGIAGGQVELYFRRCGIAFSIDLDPGEDYELSFDGYSCRIAAFHLANEEGVVTRVPVSLTPNRNSSCQEAIESNFH